MMILEKDNLLRSVVEAQPYPLLFATVSGAHLYGFASPDSDYDLRGVHVLPANEVVGLSTGDETLGMTEMHRGLEVDLVTHDLKKFIRLMLKKNGYVLEQLYSPLVVHTTPEHSRLKALGKDCITRYHSYHYLGFSKTQWRLFQKEQPPRVKPLLYVFRVLLTGIHLMRSGEVEANITRLNEGFKLPYIDELVKRKVEGKEKVLLENADMEFYEGEYLRLRAMLEEAHLESKLPERATALGGLNELLVEIRLRSAIGLT